MTVALQIANLPSTNNIHPVPRRRKKQEDLFSLGVQTVGVLVLLAFISPKAREAFSKIHLVLLIFIAVTLIVLLLMALRLLLRRKIQKSGKAPDLPHTLEAATAPALQPNPPTSLIEQLRSIDWFQFEKLVALTYRKHGYAVELRGGANPDGGIDLVISKENTPIAVQCKQWKTWNVGVKVVREFLGAMTDAGFQKGILITLQGFTPDAKQLADKHHIDMLDATAFEALITSTDAAYDPEVLELLSDTRKFCPKCQSPMVLRTTKKGPNIGQQFWGCSTYPKCRFVMPMHS